MYSTSILVLSLLSSFNIISGYKINETGVAQFIYNKSDLSTEIRRKKSASYKTPPTIVSKVRTNIAQLPPFSRQESTKEKQLPKARSPGDNSLTRTPTVKNLINKSFKRHIANGISDAPINSPTSTVKVKSKLEKTSFSNSTSSNSEVKHVFHGLFSTTLGESALDPTSKQKSISGKHPRMKELIRTPPFQEIKTRVRKDTQVERNDDYILDSVYRPIKKSPEDTFEWKVILPTPPDILEPIYVLTDASGDNLGTVFDELAKPSMSFVDQIIELERQVCSKSCQPLFKFPTINSTGIGRINCSPCFCDQQCVVLHNCCPDILLQNMTSHDGGQGSECVQTTPILFNRSDVRYTTMVTKCPDVTDSSGGIPVLKTSYDNVRSKCENINQSNIQQNVPVSSRDNGITYRNIFCARCNSLNNTDQNDLSPWGSSVKCENGMGKLLKGNPDKAEIYRRLTSEPEVAETGCRMEYTDKEFRFKKVCHTFYTPVIETCNVTGEWRFYDERLDRACKMYTSVVFRKYKNMFCYLCNIGRNLRKYELEEEINPTTTGQANTARLSFEALLDFSDTYDSNSLEAVNDGGGDETVCGERQIYDNITCQCRDVMCSEGKEISSTDPSKCTSVIQSNFFGYSVCLQLDLVFSEPIFNAEPIMVDLINGLQYCTLTKHPLYLQLSVKQWCSGNMNMSLNLKILDYDESGSKTMDELDERALEILNTELNRLPDGVKSHFISLKTDCLEDNSIAESCRKNQSLKVLGKQRECLSRNKKRKIMDNVHFYPFIMTNLCPHVDLPANDFERINDSFIHKATRFQLDRDKVDAIDEMTLRLCRDDFSHIMTSTNQSKCDESYINQSKCSESNSCSDSNNFDTWTVIGVVSIISTSLSLICLFLTFLTYIIFPSLRDASGKNIMTLALTLFFAQAFFEFALEQFENKTACTVFGIVIHYFWLAAVFSMNSCTVERFYKLCFPLKSRQFVHSNKPFLLALVYSLVSPLVIVGINILVNYNTTGEIGYGNSRSCYINKLYSRIFAFAVPLAILIITNLILFVFTIHTIRQQTVPSNKSSSSRIGFKACVQLSFVTGLTWFLAFLYEIIPFTPLSYIFTALICLQGVLFFYSVIYNKRILALYRSLLTSHFGGSSSGTISGSSSRLKSYYVSSTQILGHKTNLGGKKYPSNPTLTTSVGSVTML